MLRISTCPALFPGLGTATAGTPFSSSKISFTISAGNIDFVAGDAFTVPTTPPPLAFHQIAGTNALFNVDGIPSTALAIR